MLELDAQDDGVHIISDGSRLFARQVIVSAGMWSAQLLGAPFDSLLQVCRQQLYWFRLDEPERYPARSPSFILHSADDVDACYGFPPIPGEGSVKIATEQYSASSQPDSLDRQPSSADAQRLLHKLLSLIHI